MPYIETVLDSDFQYSREKGELVVTGKTHPNWEGTRKQFGRNAQRSIARGSNKLARGIEGDGQITTASLMLLLPCSSSFIVCRCGGSPTPYEAPFAYPSTQLRFKMR
jgi:hypothetical protein